MALQEEVADDLHQVTKSLGNLQNVSNNGRLKKERIGYFSFPAELRNRIMDLALVPGDIYPHLPPQIDSGPSMNTSHTRLRPNVGAQVLATNRQAYNEGRDKYYSGNRFHMPSLSATNCRYIFGRYQSENLALIRHIILGCHLDQLSNDGLLGYIEGDMLAAKEEKGYLDRRFYGTYVEQTLYVIWKSKLLLIRETFPSIESLVIVRDCCGGTDELRLEGSRLQDQFKRMDKLGDGSWEQERSLESLDMILDAARTTARKLKRSIEATGWEETRKRLLTEPDKYEAWESFVRPRPSDVRTFGNIRSFDMGEEHNTPNS